MKKPEIKNDNANNGEIKIKEIPESEESAGWSEKQRRRSYYYDDSYGYEKYDPENDCSEEE